MKKNLFILMMCGGLFACTNLDEDIYSSIKNEDFYQSERQVLASAGPAYVNLRAYTNPDSPWGLNTLTTDEMLIPTRGIHWYNGGIFQRYHRHEWTTSEGAFNASWTFIYSSINSCNRTLYQFSQLEEPSETVTNIGYELRGLRAFYFFNAVDMFGNVPLVDRFDVPEGYAPENEDRKAVFDFTVGELNEILPNLAAPGSDMYGRFHKMAAYATLAKLYLNAEVYTGQPMWDEAIAACDAIINSGLYSLQGDYFANFAKQNQGSTENIFVIPYSETLPTDWGSGGVPARSFQHHLWGIHFNGMKRFAGENGGWNGMCAVPSFYKSYDSTDIRRQIWLQGLQTSTSGEILYCNQERAGEPLIYTADLTGLETAYENEGVRLAKYDYTAAKNFELESDFAIFRYADILLMKAEALMRKNGGMAPGEAVDLVNQVRARAFPNMPEKLYTAGTLTLDAMLAERGWELAGEGWRRNDLVRFGQYIRPWDFKEQASPQTRNLFPIPQSQLNANPSLSQNPGY
ncbi:Starch-binding associating with outer membrane [Catalinimonas alkaloidigena]|uniref:Starch-binding associating with outer membrane n=1 Tax=Catalinimonas alkaloidigena TaxID=1075417 RepID=A0A1G9QGL6_9BACT|nr:RagB/SusD family nutrient uptake outer membrane protein [Catalinimonas alkaloidigena]SDM10126.1 Starch-binding associating with outer membrane [Catalinimonas alkaloidigena]